MKSATDPRALVAAFLAEVRSGCNPESAAVYLAARVQAHQIDSFAPATVERTPADYADHVREMQRCFGAFTLEVTELLAEGDRVYARWIQRGHHRAEIDGHPPTGAPLVEFGSAVYRVTDGRIVEYWIQVDHAGLRNQLDSWRRSAPPCERLAAGDLAVLGS